MQAHFSIISASIRPEIQEQIAIGLLLVGGDAVYFRESKNKISVVKGLITQQSFKFLKESLKQIDTASSSKKEDIKNLFPPTEKVNRSFSAGYLEYLSRYSNNLIIFSTPKTIDLQANKALFESLFEKYVDNSVLIENDTKLGAFEVNSNRFFKKVQPFFNVHKEITSKDLPGLISPVKFDLIGKNEIPVYAQAIDMEHSNYSIQNDLALLFMLNDVIQKDKKGFHIASEPDKKLFPSQHDTWKGIKALKVSEYVDLSEVDKIKDYAKSHGVIPLVK